MSRFSWTRLPDRLARQLVRDLGLGEDAAVVDAPAAALSAAFGETPTEEFVRRAWPLLVEFWLGTDPDARTDVVAQLRAAGLGDHATAPRTKAAQLAYLKTCRNTTRLRQTVLDRFLEVGTPVRHDGAPRVHPPQTQRLFEDPATMDLQAKVDHAWDDLSGGLAGALAALPVGAHLLLTLDPSAGAGDEASYYVAFLVPDNDELLAEAVGNASLPTEHRLDRASVAALVALGWSPPGVVEGTAATFGMRVRAAEAKRLAAITVRTLREVYGVPHPAFLTYTFQAVDDEVRLPRLGAARPAPHEPGTVERTTRSRPAARTPSTEGSEQTGPLVDRVKDVVAELLETSPAELSFDEDGDIAIRSGSAMVFVKVHTDPALVDVYSPVLTEVTPTERLYERLSALTRSMPIGRLYVADGTVWASVAVFGRDFQPSHLALAIKVMTGLADALDDRLQGDFGGKKFFDAAALRPGGDSESGGDSRTGMYL